MASIAGSYDENAEPSSGYTPLPVGEYQLEIVESDYVATQSGNGMILKCKAQVVGGDFDGRPFYINYNLENANETAQDIGQRDFAGLRRAVGVLAPQDTEELHFKAFGVKIGQRKRKDTGELENNIVKYLFDGEQSAPPPAANNNRQAAQQPKPAAASGGSKPWRK